MKIQATVIGVISAIASLAVISPVQASIQTREAFCMYFVNGSVTPQAAMPCKVASKLEVFDAEIVWQDGVRQSFRNYDGVAFTYRDDRGGKVYKKLGLYDPSERFETVSDRAYQMENGMIYIWWRR
ncbi:hypothetical protein PseudUWO311_11250 [Pseudanabaena sp. UWO311]|uniref:hypothetical protein n=1 Tax=Pseudanabaena sp. UWO311 TaxID=2487337 RepID=UPI0011572D97|nr:hypothetical protein [Pseudanabaena sp. UWO311]TYQ26679.1 hypothetical protein PseudUWO311_11250 [Pseudanabaena sp. UWO311]